MSDEAQPGMTAPPLVDDAMDEPAEEFAEDLAAPAVQEPPFSSADSQEPSPSPAQQTHPEQV